MNKLSILLQKEVLLALGAIVFVGAVVASGTGAFFSSQASATANVFTAGTLTLKIAKDSNGTPVNGWLASQAAPWNLTALTPGGTPEESAVWLKNEGSVDGMTLGVAMDNAAATVSGTAAQMRITEMTLGGNSLLQGGAGATISAYEAPTNCDVTVSGTTITAAIGSATAGDVICVAPGDYNAGWEGSSVINVDETVTLVSTQGPDVTTSIPFNITSANVTIKGFGISAPNGTYGVYVNAVGGASVLDNKITNIGTSLAEGSAQAVYLNGSTGVAGFVVKNNQISNVGNLSLNKGAGSGSSAKGVYIGDTAGTNSVTGVVIENNIISNVMASTDPFNGNIGGRGAYGILTNHGGDTVGMVIKNNTITDLEGLWSHAIGLEKNTSNAAVTYNSISDIVDHKSPSDAVGVMIESNTAAGTVTINQNNFALSVALGISNVTGITVNGQNNWWGDFTAAGRTSGLVNTNGALGGPVSGLINGNDWNSNGYADLQDLNNDPILNAGVGLDAGEQKQFVMAVQLDGPTTGNEFQGASLTTDLVFTLNQI